MGNVIAFKQPKQYSKHTACAGMIVHVTGLNEYRDFWFPMMVFSTIDEALWETVLEEIEVRAELNKNAMVKRRSSSKVDEMERLAYQRDNTLLQLLKTEIKKGNVPYPDLDIEQYGGWSSIVIGGGKALLCVKHVVIAARKTP